jgi:hypothetical protein
MPGNPRECRAHAAACRKLAREAPSREARQHFMSLALSWEELAADLESAQVFIETMEAMQAEKKPKAA